MNTKLQFPKKRKDITGLYSYDTILTDYDIHLLGEGNHYKSYEKLGARQVRIDGINGVHFAVWAPNAVRISVIGNFNNWDRDLHPLSRIRNSDFWGIFVPELAEGETYKFAIETRGGEILEKADPYAFYTEMRPCSASIVKSIDKYKWHDQDWLKNREKFDFTSSAISIYEVHLGSWKRNRNNDWGFLNYKDLAYELVLYVKKMGYTHIELMPIMEHPFDASWGYQTINYFAPSSRFGTPDEFMYFVDCCHQNNIGVILDWVPSHFVRDGHGLNMFDGTQIYAYEDWRRGEHKEWGTLVFDYFRPQVRSFLISNALFWLDKYHVDGLRVDAVASMLYLDYSRKDGEWSPNMFGGREHLEAIDFIKRFNEVVHAEHKGILTIAEESTAWTNVSRPTYIGGLGFSLKWNMGWMHDTLEYFSKDSIYRKYHQNTLTFSMIYAFTENFVLPFSHDEVVYGKRSLLEKMPGDDWQKFANLRLLFGYMFTHPGKKLLFMGDDFAQRAEWNFDSSLNWHELDEYEAHQQINLFVKDVNFLYREKKALHELDFDTKGFEWVDFSDSGASVISFLRFSRERKSILVVCNMTPVPREGYRIGVPGHGFYQEILNSDAREYGGSGIGSLGGVYSEPVNMHGKQHSVSLNLPPLAINIFEFKDYKEVVSS